MTAPDLSPEAVERLVRDLERADEYEPLGHDGWEAAAILRAQSTEIDRLRTALERIETASQHWAEYEAAPDAVHYAHESTARLARAALKEARHDR